MGSIQFISQWLNNADFVSAERGEAHLSRAAPRRRFPHHLPLRKDMILFRVAGRCGPKRSEAGPRRARDARPGPHRPGPAAAAYHKFYLAIGARSAPRPPKKQLYFHSGAAFRQPPQRHVRLLPNSVRISHLCWINAKMRAISSKVFWPRVFDGETSFPEWGKPELLPRFVSRAHSFFWGEEGANAMGRHTEMCIFLGHASSVLFHTLSLINSTSFEIKAFL